MNTSRATVGIAIVFLAAALSLAGTPHTVEGGAAFTGDPSVPPASEVFRVGDTKNVSQGNVEDMAY
jgi:hypothetical protein